MITAITLSRKLTLLPHWPNPSGCRRIMNMGFPCQSEVGDATYLVGFVSCWIYGHVFASATISISLETFWWPMRWLRVSSIILMFPTLFWPIEPLGVLSHFWWFKEDVWILGFGFGIVGDVFFTGPQQICALDPFQLLFHAPRGNLFFGK